MMKKDTIIWIIFWASILGLFAAGYTTYAHYHVEANTICTLGEKFSCDVVNQSSYSQIFGIPVAILGLAAYTFFLLFAYDSTRKIRAGFLKAANVLVVGGLLFSFYLTGIEAFVLKTWCLFCLTSQFAILVIAWAFYELHRSERVRLESKSDSGADSTT